MKQQTLMILNSRLSAKQLSQKYGVNASTVYWVWNYHDKKTLDLIQQLLNTLSPKQKESQ